MAHRERSPRGVQAKIGINEIPLLPVPYAVAVPSSSQFAGARYSPKGSSTTLKYVFTNNHDLSYPKEADQTSDDCISVPHSCLYVLIAPSLYTITLIIDLCSGWLGDTRSPERMALLYESFSKACD